jgi:protein-S-isoprenylcysteine O-methyltransferase Ste14
MDISFVVPAVAFCLGLAGRVTYELLQEAGRVNPRSTRVFALVFLAMTLFWSGWFTMCLADPLPLDLPEAVHVAGMAGVLLGTSLALGALFQLRGLENIDRLVTTELFARLRHPMYTGFLFWIIGWAVFHGAAASAVAGAVGVAAILWWRRLEDRRLETRFGEPYRRYRARTWF